MEAAAEWYALLRSGEATGGDQARWQSWLAASPDHRRAWGYVETVSRSFAPLQATPDPRRTADNLWAANGRVIRRRRAFAGIAVLAGSGLLGWAGWRHAALPGVVLAGLADHRTGTGELREIVLADGTRVWLGAVTAINEDYRAGLRRLKVVAGEILIDTAPDPARPFVVDTPHGRLRALGTRFTVRLEDGGSTFLAVYQGAVEVQTGAGDAAIVSAGRQLRFAATLGSQETADAAREAWSRGVLVARDIPLEQVVKELRPYRTGHLGVAPEVAGLRVFGSFPLRNTDETLAMLESALPIRIQRTLPWWVSIEAKGEAASR
ncbi:DUF4880 domain-containing protein [Pseudothauera rhizosphaerae]|uniref:DUF4880 domain-containing protein n=2 Tax=Pseudothauera rhizosphaerae TaxID=2565932 RepID=A0A4S4ASB6_9RHOO|nr:DUF4880 domain-containing protein [Pseudothauera rhizosphaerae]